MPVRGVDEDSNILGCDTVLSGSNENFQAHKAGAIPSSTFDTT